jgi:hypothetical protein
MKTTADYLDDLKNKYNVESDAAAARIVGVKHRQQVSRWRQQHGTFDDALCLDIADALDLDPTEVILAMHHQREKNETLRHIWERIAERMYAPALFAIAAVTLTLCNITYVGDSLSYVGLVGSLALQGSLTQQSIHYA